MKKMPLYKTGLDLYTEKLDNGLEVFIIPNHKVHSVYAQYTTKYGSIHNKFVPLGEKEMIEVPKGVAHFLEHKVFEQEDGTNASDFFANIGADDNANTSHYRTTYLFSANEDFQDECIEFLQDYVEHPYFTDKNVEKEKGIIVQEIEMYMDNPGSVLFEGLSYNVVKEHPFRYSIIGTEKSVNSIDKDILYRCYNTFYHPANMFITVTGNVDPEHVLKNIKKHQKNRAIEPFKDVEIPMYDEPDEVFKEFEEKKMNVTIPRLGIAYKFNVEELMKKYNLPIEDVTKYISMYFSLKTNTTSELYEQLENEGLLTYSMGGESVYLDKHAIVYVHAIAKDPKTILEKVEESIKNFDITEETFNRYKKATLADLIGCTDSIYEMSEKVLNDVVNFSEVRLDYIKKVEDRKYETFKNIANELDLSNRSVYIIYPEKD